MPETVLGTRNDDRRTHIERINDPSSSQERTMTDAQFAEMIALMTKLLTPGYELSLMYLAQVEADKAAQKA